MARHELALKKIAEGLVIPATPLALGDDYKFDEKTQRTLIQYYLHSKVGGIATAVHSTQFEIRDNDVMLFEPLLKIVAQEIDTFEKETGAVVAKICGVCGNTQQAVKEASLAKAYGYDAVLLSPGGLNHLPEEELLNRAKQVASIMPVIGFYLQTAVGGRVFSYDFWQKFCEIENVVAIKCASFNRYTTLDVVRAATLSSRADKITLYTGNDDNIVFDLLSNYEFTVDGNIYKNEFKGGLLGHWCVWTKAVVDMFEELKLAKAKACIDKKWMTLATQITDANGVIFDEKHNFHGCIPGLHEILKRQGIFKNINCLNPNEVLSKGQSEEIDRIYSMYPHLNDDDFVCNFLNTKI